jgi:hypothetical protein
MNEKLYQHDSFEQTKADDEKVDEEDDEDYDVKDWRFHSELKVSREVNP